MATPRSRFDQTDPTDLQPDQRLREMAAVLAAGILRLQTDPSAIPIRRSRNRVCTTESPRKKAAIPPKNPQESGEDGLELSRDGCPDGQRG